MKSPAATSQEGTQANRPADTQTDCQHDEQQDPSLPFLPQEILDEIWGYAEQSVESRPEAHYATFSKTAQPGLVCRYKHKTVKPGENHVGKDGLVDIHTERYQWPVKELAVTWIKQKRHIITLPDSEGRACGAADAGLWHACPASLFAIIRGLAPTVPKSVAEHLVMHKALEDTGGIPDKVRRFEETYQVRADLRGYSWLNKVLRSKESFRYKKGSVWRWQVTRPGRDLFIIKSVDCQNVLDISYNDDAENIAFEYDASWNSSFAKPPIDHEYSGFRGYDRIKNTSGKTESDRLRILPPPLVRDKWRRNHAFATRPKAMPIHRCSVHVGSDAIEESSVACDLSGEDEAYQADEESDSKGLKQLDSAQGSRLTEDPNYALGLGLIQKANGDNSNEDTDHDSDYDSYCSHKYDSDYPPGYDSDFPPEEELIDSTWLSVSDSDRQSYDSDSNFWSHDNLLSDSQWEKYPPEEELNPPDAVSDMFMRPIVLPQIQHDIERVLKKKSQGPPEPSPSRSSDLPLAELRRLRKKRPRHDRPPCDYFGTWKESKESPANDDARYRTEEISPSDDDLYDNHSDHTEPPEGYSSCRHLFGLMAEKTELGGLLRMLRWWVPSVFPRQERRFQRRFWLIDHELKPISEDAVRQTIESRSRKFSFNALGREYSRVTSRSVWYAPGRKYVHVTAKTRHLWTTPEGYISAADFIHWRLQYFLLYHYTHGPTTRRQHYKGPKIGVLACVPD